MSTSLTKRPGKLAGKLNPRVEFHGEDEVGACDFTILNLVLDRDELNDLAKDPTLWDRLYDSSGPMPEPALRKFDMPLQFVGKFEAATVTIRIGDDDEKLVLGKSKLAKIQLWPKSGGMTELALQVQCNPDAAELSTLYMHMNNDVMVSIRFGREAVKSTKDQPELPLGHDASLDSNGAAPPTDGTSEDDQAQAAA